MLELLDLDYLTRLVIGVLVVWLYVTDFIAWWTAERTSVLLNFGLLALAGVSAIYAKKMLKHSQEIEKNANRPMMAARILKPEQNLDDLKFEISNMGRSVAKDVKVAFDPPLPSPNLNRLNENSPLKVTYNASILQQVYDIFDRRIFSTWVPGESVSVSYWSPPKEEMNIGTPLPMSGEGVPPVQTIVIDFDDEFGEHYTERFELNVATVLGIDFLETNNGNLDKNMKKTYEELARINSSLGQISRKISSKDV